MEVSKTQMFVLICLEKILLGKPFKDHGNNKKMGHREKKVLKCCPKFKNQYLKWHFYKNIPIKMNKNNHYYKIKN